MAFDVNNPYFRNEVLTASPQKLRLLLLDGCLHFMREGRAGLEAKNFEAVYENFTSAKDIVLELISGMDASQNPEVSGNLTRLYTFVFTRLTEASFEKSIPKVDECLKIMAYERETWAMLMDKLAAEQAPGKAGAPSVGGRASPQTPQAPEPPQRATGTYGPPARAASNTAGPGLNFSA